MAGEHLSAERAAEKYSHVQEWLSRQMLQGRLGLGVTAIRRLTEQNEHFPKPKFIEGHARWSLSDVRKWEQEHLK